MPLAAEQSTRFFPMLTTAAGTVKPATVLVLGVGVAGLQALATARRIGARTTGYDVRPEVAEQVRSLGAQWLDLVVHLPPGGIVGNGMANEQRGTHWEPPWTGDNLSWRPHCSGASGPSPADRDDGQ